MNYLDTPVFRYLYKKCVPWWLSSGQGGAVLETIGQMCDDFAARCQLGLLARFPEYAPSDALSLIGHDRKIVRGINESDAAYAARLKRYLTDHRVRGNPFALCQQLRAYCQAPVRVRTYDNSGTCYTLDFDGSLSVTTATGWNWDNTPGDWSRFWVVIYPVGGVNPWAISGDSWTDPTLWGDNSFGHTDLTFGTTATHDEAESVRAIVRDWKPAGTLCEWIILAFDTADFQPASPDAADGHWGEWLYGDSESRLTTARYWLGPRDEWTI